MEERSLDERKLQEFYLHSPVNSLSTPETLTIPARWDAEAGCHVVLLDDVQVIFKDAHYVAENGCTIPFMKDNDSQELIPLRIKYRQGAILEIVADAADTLLAHIKRYEPYIESMMSRQETGMSGPHDSIEKLTESTSQGVSDDKKQVLQMKELVDGWASREQKDQEAQSNRQEMEQHMLEKQQQILQDQQRNIDRLAAIQERIQDTMALTLSARVQPFPRLFIVLPTQFSIWLNPVKFSLFFLCEPSHSSTSIHLARHKGYEIRDVEKFFQIYTPYIMSMTYILKNGIASPGLNIPCLSHLTLAEDVSEVQDVLSLKNNTIPSLMNDTISYIRDMTPYIRGIASNASVTRMNSQVALDVLESTVIDSATNYLVGFLEQEQTLGNMNQVITPDVVRWVCAEHFTDRQCEVVEDYQAEDADEEEHKNTIDDKGQWSLDELAKVAEPHGSQDIAREKAGATLGGKVGQESSTHEEFIRKFVLRHSNAKQTAPFAYNAESIAWTAREKEIAALGGEVEQRPTALQELIRAVSDSHENVRETAVRVLRGPSKVSRTALEAVIKAANDSHWNVQEAALQVLADQSQLSEGLVTVLIHNAGYGNVTVTRAAKAALIKHASSGPICQQLVHILLNGAISAQMVAIEVLATLVKLPESAIEALITTLETLEDNDRDFSSPAVHALLCQSELPESAIQSLVMVAKEGTLGASQAAIRVLESQILVSGPVIPALIECLKDESEHVRRTVVQGLRDDHKLPQSTVQQLMEVLSHGHVEIRETSTEILGGQVTLSEATMQALIKSPNNDPIVKDASVQGSGSQVERPQSEIGALVGILKDREKAVASSLLDIFKALKEQETEPVTLEELRRQRTKILQRTVVKSCKMIDFKDVTDIQRLTPRGQSRIQTAEWSCLRVVLKGVRPDSKEGVERFDQELEILKRVHDYDFIVPFYGVTTDPRTNVRYIVKKYCSNGNLTSFLESHHHDLTWLERYRICIDVVKGLEFLHKSGFYHRNLHSGNILLDDKRTAMLCDFGLSRSSSRYQTTEDSATVGLVTFMAPERLFTQRPVYAASCDIYSLGLIFWHISSGHIPFASEMGSTALLRGLTKGRREEIVPGTPREFQDLIVKCWDKRPSRRLKIRVVITILQALIARPSEPVNWILSVNARLSERALTAHPVPPDLDKIKNLEQAPNMLNRMVFDIQDPVMKETADYIESTRAYFRDSGSSQKPYSPSNPPKTPIYLCPILGDIAALRYYLSQDGYNRQSINKSSVQTGDTALHLACLFLESPMDTIKVLVEIGADINQKNLRGYTPVMILISSNTQHCYEAVKYLRRCGARIPAYIPIPITPLNSTQLYISNLVKESERTTLRHQFSHYWNPRLEIGEQQIAQSRPLIHVVAAMQDDDRILDCLCEAGLDPAVSFAEETALVAAAAHLRIRNIEWLLNNDLEISTEANIQRAIDVVKALHVNLQQVPGVFSPLTGVDRTSGSVSQEYLNSVRDLRKYSWTGIASDKAADRLSEDMVGPVLDLLEQWTGDRRIVNRRHVATKLKLRIPSGQKEQRYLIDQVLNGYDA